MPFCTKCGSELREGVAFCTKCGAAVKVAAAKAMPESGDQAAGSAEAAEPAKAPESAKVAKSAKAAESAKVAEPAKAAVPAEPKRSSNPVGKQKARSSANEPIRGRYVEGPENPSGDLKKVFDAAKRGVSQVEERISSTAKETAESFKAAERGEDTDEDPFAEKASALILNGIRWSKKQKKKLEEMQREASREQAVQKDQWLVIPLLALLVLLLLIGCLLIFSLSSSRSASPSSSSATISSAKKASSSSSKKKSSAAATKVEEKKTYATTIKVKCNKNLLFSTYDVRIYIDGSPIATLDHGDKGSWEKELTEGAHRIRVCEKGDDDVDGSKSFEVTADSVLKCTVSTSSSQVEFADFSCKTKEEIKKAKEAAKKKKQRAAQKKLEAQQYVSDGTGANHNVHFAISTSSSFFSDYDLNFYLDGSFIKTVERDQKAEWDQELGGGKHVLRFASIDDDSLDVMQEFTVSEQSYLSCKVRCDSSEVEVQDYKFETQTEKDQEAEKTKVLTVENCEDLANMLNSPSSDASAFAAAYRGRTIEFDGNIAYMSQHDNCKTRFDVLIYSGDYSETSARGPHMRYEDVNYYDMGVSGIDSVQMGLNVRIKAVVENYDASHDILALKPVSMTAR